MGGCGGEIFQDLEKGRVDADEREDVISEPIGRILEHGAPLSPLNPGSVNKGKKKLTHLLPIRTGLRDSVHHALINGSSCHETTAHWGNGV